MTLDKRSIPVGSPAGFAYTVSNKKWLRARHLDYLNRAIVEAAAGRITYLIVSMPPRHGKSELISRYTPAWYLGVFPDRRVILTSYESDQAGAWGYKARQLIEEHGEKIFGVKVDPSSSARIRWDLLNHDGGMNTAGAGGPITGKGAHLLIIDDPIKDAKEANSQAFRDNQWDWWQSTASSRLEPGGVVIVVATRWHQDDLSGRLIKQLKNGEINETYKLINFPAIAIESDVIGRVKGEALWPWRYPADKLLSLKNSKTAYWWSSQYQGNPLPPGGNIFKRAWFKIINAKPSESRITARIRFWDIAATSDGGDYTVATLMSKTTDGEYFVENVIRGQWGAKDLTRIFIQTLELDGRDVAHRMEEEPGASGKVTTNLYANLADKWDFEAVSPQGSKDSRWKPFADQSEVGNVYLVEGDWNSKWLDELQNVPSGLFDDQADSGSGAFNSLVQLKNNRGIVVI